MDAWDGARRGAGGLTGPTALPPPNRLPCLTNLADAKHAAGEPQCRPAPRTALLVEDDGAIHRLVEAVAQDLGVRLVHAGDLGAASTALKGTAFDVLLADLMLPDGSGVDWLERQAAQGRLADTRVVAFSAGASPAARVRLGAAGVQAFLTKPVSVRTLTQWLSPAPPQAPPTRAASHDAAATAVLTQPAAHARPAPPRGATAATAQLFAGDRVLYANFRAACLARVASDQQQGQDWLQQGDLAALGRLAHSLKSALRLLGEPDLATQAQALELRCEGPAGSTGTEAEAAWRQLAAGLSAWAAQPHAS
jgi:CheY-like chemotaxis protein